MSANTREDAIGDTTATVKANLRWRGINDFRRVTSTIAPMGAVRIVTDVFVPSHFSDSDREIVRDVLRELPRFRELREHGNLIAAYTDLP